MAAIPETRRRPSGPKSGRQSSQIPVLDGVRGIAILMVLVCHLTLTVDALPRANLFEKLVRYAMDTGWSGVDLFFVLSGFLITGILLDTQHSSNRAISFYARRGLRILPLYYLAIAVGFFAVPAIHQKWLSDLYPTGQGWLSYVFYVQNWWMPLKEREHVLLGQFWSLGVEEQFYFFWPLCVWHTPRRHLAKLCLAGMATAFVLRFVLVQHHPNSPVILMSTATRMDSLLCGALCAVTVRNRSLMDKARRLIPYCAAVAVMGMVVIDYWAGELISRSFYTQSVGYSLLAVGFGALVLKAYDSHGTGGRLERVLSFDVLRMFGKYSYGIYVYHGIVLAVAARTFKHHSWFAQDILPSTLFCLGSIGASLLVAVLSYELFEKWFLALKVRFSPRPSGA